MKKFIVLIASILAVVCSCERTIVVDNSSNEIAPKDYVMVGSSYATDVTPVMTKAGATVTEESIQFYIRIDNNIPGVGSYPASQYFPQRECTNGSRVWYSSYLGVENRGSFNSDHDYNYTTSGIKYVFDSKGNATADMMLSVPDLKTMLEANQNPNYDMSSFDYDNLKVIWYIVKYEDRFWHADGVLTTKDVESVYDTSCGDKIKDENKDSVDENDVYVPKQLSGEVEVDIHQQEHKDWDEIKTSIHIRDTVNVKVNIPLPEAMIEKADDVVVRIYKGYTVVSDAPVTIVLDHNEDAVTVDVKDITNTIIKALREADDDGVTIEVHTYNKFGLDHSDVFDMLKQSTVETYPDLSNVKLSVSSAFEN